MKEVYSCILNWLFGDRGKMHQRGEVLICLGLETGKHIIIIIGIDVY